MRFRKVQGESEFCEAPSAADSVARAVPAVTSTSASGSSRWLRTVPAAHQRPSMTVVSTLTAGDRRSRSSRQRTPHHTVSPPVRPVRWAGTAVANSAAPPMWGTMYKGCSPSQFASVTGPSVFSLIS